MTETLRLFRTASGRLRELLVVAVVLPFASSADAHRVGNKNWCLMTMTTHLECVYDNDDACENALKAMLTFTKNLKPRKTANVAGEGEPVPPRCTQVSSEEPFYQPDPLSSFFKKNGQPGL